MLCNEELPVRPAPQGLAGHLCLTCLRILVVQVYHDVDHMVVHHANVAIADMMAMVMGVP